MKRWSDLRLREEVEEVERSQREVEVAQRGRGLGSLSTVRIPRGLELPYPPKRGRRS
jgi:hypothetical protein